MADLFREKAADWDQQPVPVQISAAVSEAIVTTVPLSSTMEVLDFGAGTGLVCGKIAPHVARVVAVDVSEAMLAQLSAKPELKGRVEPRCQDILAVPLADRFDLVVSAMAMHHVKDTRALVGTLFAHLRPGGQLALADLDAEDGRFHPPGVDGVYHAGFDREALSVLLVDAGFVGVGFLTAGEVVKEGRRYPIFLVTARRSV